ncbi:MAG: glycoside hydrolase family 2, partial [Proteiniphilum sp.]|nr:glycoside hydrolase family 2 [Proteiniphilum sp.]
EVLSKEIQTAGKPSQIRLTADRKVIRADGVDLCFITVEVLDEKGTLCPNAENLIRFSTEGKGQIVGVDNGSPTSLERFKASERKAFYGKCLVVMQSEKSDGVIHLTAESDGLMNESIEIVVERQNQ